MIEEGTHDYGRAADKDYAARAARLAAAMDAEHAAGVPMINKDDGTIIPAKLADRTEGWVGDRSHEEGLSERLLSLYARMDAHTDAVREFTRTGKSDRLIGEAVALSTAWRRIREELDR